MKRITAFVLFYICILAFNVYGAESINVIVDGNYVTFSNSEPKVIGGRTMVPVRDIFEAIGADVIWEPQERKIVAVKEKNTLVMTLNSRVIYTNGNMSEMDCEPEVINGRTFVPVRYAVEAFGYSVSWNSEDKSVIIKSRENDVKIHFIDVGQGDCTVIDDNGHCMIIDGGESENGDKIVNYIKGLGISKIDYVIATHPHADHIGGLCKVIGNFDVNNIIMPDAVSSSKVFENFLSAVEKSNAKVIKAENGNKYKLGLSEFNVVGPIKPDGNMNNNSVVIKLRYGNNSVLLAGDAEYEEENDIVNSGVDISADVLKVGHHGSKTSTSDEFVSKVKPKYVVISVGKDNNYGHPSEDIIEKIGKMGVSIYRTDTMGNIVMTFDGDNVSIITYKEKNTTNNTEEEIYVLNTANKKVHKSDCYAVKKISNENRASFSGDLEKLIKEGYSACGICRPF